MAGGRGGKPAAAPPAISQFDELMANRAIQLAAAGRLDEAEPLLRQFVRNNPKFAAGHYNLGKVLRGRGLDQAAADAFRQAARLAPGFAAAHLNLANTLQDLDRLREALDAYRRVLACDAGAIAAAAHAARLQAMLAEWNGLEELETRVIAAARDSGGVPPFTLLSMPASRDDLRAACANWGRQYQRAVQPPAVTWRPECGRRLRLGYASNDFRSHALAMLISETLERHDRSRFEVFGYSFCADDHSAARRRFVAAFDHFIDLHGASDEAAAGRIATDGIDILVDLNGYTWGARAGVFARRPAPVQVNYLGFPGTLGVPFYDVIIGDDTVTPPEHQPDYAERIERLAHTYQPNDTRRAVAAEVPSRRECGLPADGFVFCCFNNTFKIRPEMFDIWMRLLRQVPGSVLWLIEGEGSGNLRREAKKRGIAPERLVFARRVAADIHLARHAHADLFLDTLPYNAHTTASDALWMGVPVLTCLGDTFAARVGASLIRAAGLPELVTASLDEYETLALALARDPARLAALRQRLIDGRGRTPLFDAARHTADLEEAYLRMASITL